MRIWACIALALTLGTPAADAPLPAHSAGRVVKEAGGAMRFGWPGVYFEGRFRGTGVTVEAEPGEDQLGVLVDGVEKAVLRQPGGGRVTIDGLAAGEHVVRLEKRTESQSGSARFLGFRATGGGTALPPRPRPRRIEFIGDSHTVGYGNTSPVRECTRQQVHDTTNTQLAFGPIAAKRLNADYRIIAYSGYGIVRNYNGGVPGDSLPKRYARAIPGEEAAAAEDGWRPDVIVIDLGTNDFSTKLHAGEAWADDTALRADYRAKYADFVRMLRTKQPQAEILLMGSDAFYADVEKVAAAVGGGAVTTLRLPAMELTGCDWHPSLADHRMLAGLVYDTVRGIPAAFH